MQNNLMVVAASVFIGIVVVIVIVQYFRRRASAWSGVVIDKGFSESVRNITPRANGSTGAILTFGSSAQNIVSRNYYLVVKKDDGKELRWGISEGMYQTLNIGDKLNKPSGTMIPEIIH